jgi:hypothetical protein
MGGKQLSPWVFKSLNLQNVAATPDDPWTQSGWQEQPGVRCEPRLWIARACRRGTTCAALNLASPGQPGRGTSGAHHGE